MDEAQRSRAVSLSSPASATVGGGCWRAGSGGTVAAHPELRGVLGGIGLGLGYIVPLATLIKWFPTTRLDHRDHGGRIWSGALITAPRCRGV